MNCMYCNNPITHRNMRLTPGGELSRVCKSCHKERNISKSHGTRGPNIKKPPTGSTLMQQWFRDEGKREAKRRNYIGEIIEEY